MGALLSCVLLLASAGQSDYRERFPFPTATVPEGWGVNIHFAEPQQGEMELLAAAGFKYVRYDLAWARVERERGVYVFDRYDSLMTSLGRHGIRPLFILDYGNKLYGEDSPRSPEQRKAFVNYVLASMRRYANKGVIWELWNEPNIRYWQPKPDPDEYATLALEVGEAVRREFPNEWLMGPALSKTDWPYLEAVFKRGVLKYFDAVSIHPYRHKDPETVLEDWQRLRQMIDQYAPEGRTVRMVSGEWGYSLAYKEQTPKKQAQYAVRQYLVNLMCGVPLTIWYDWKDDGPDRGAVEHNFGLVSDDLRPKQSYEAVQNLSRALDGFAYVSRVDFGSAEDFGLIFKNGTRRKLVAWTTHSKEREVTVPLSAGYFTSPGGSRARRLNLTNDVQILEQQ